MGRSGFEVLDHPADMGLAVWAPDRARLVEECIRALVSVLVDPDTLESSQERSLSIEAPDYEQALYQVLCEILFYFDAEKFLCARAVIEQFSLEGGTCRLKIRLFGERFSRGKHQLKTYVKAITFHQLQVLEEGESSKARIFLDI